MSYFNSLNPNGGNHQFINPSINQNSNQGIDIQKMKQVLSQLDNNKLQRLVAQARLQGVSERDIEAGLQIIQQIKFSS